MNTNFLMNEPNLHATSPVEAVFIHTMQWIWLKMDLACDIPTYTRNIYYDISSHLCICNGNIYAIYDTYEKIVGETYG